MAHSHKAKEKFRQLFILTNPLIEKWLRLYLKSNHRKFEQAMSRGLLYKEMILTDLKPNLPSELIYLPLIESGYRNRIRSKAKAVGLWQFVRGTARAYGLKINRYIDERRDPYYQLLLLLNIYKTSIEFFLIGHLH